MNTVADCQTWLCTVNFSVLHDSKAINALQAAWKVEMCTAIPAHVVFSFTGNLLFKAIDMLGLDQRVIAVGVVSVFMLDCSHIFKNESPGVRVLLAIITAALNLIKSCTIISVLP